MHLGGKYGIRVTHYYGTRRAYTGSPNFVTRPYTIERPLLKQIQGAVDYFRQVARNSPPKLKGAGFAPTFLIPEWAFQEAITNAVIHRNYAVQDDIQLRFHDDRIEAESPETHPGHITPQNIRDERFARNPLILRTLSRFVLAPNLDIGEGVVYVAGPSRRCLECSGQYNSGHVAMEMNGDLDDPVYIEALPEDSPLKQSENVFAFSMALASAEVLKLVQLVVAPAGVVAPVCERVNYPSGVTTVERIGECCPNCQFPGVTALGEDAGHPGILDFPGNLPDAF